MGAGSEETARIRAVATRFFDAVESGDVETVLAIYHPDVVVWHNTDNIEKNRDTNLEVLRGFVVRAPERHYTNRRLEVFPGGFVHQHLLKAKQPDGRVLELAACVICKVEGEQIVRLDEYFDSAALAGWFDPA